VEDWGGELVHVGAPGLIGAPADGARRLGELLGELADIDRELSALPSSMLVGAEGAMDLPVDLWQSVERRRGPAVAEQRGDRAGADRRCGAVAVDAARARRES
jgi:hypothetical protein